MKAKLLLCFSLLSFFQVSQAQTWEHNYPMPYAPYVTVNDYIFDSIDGGIIVGGSSITASQSFIVRINTLGDTIWTQFNDTAATRYYPDAVVKLSNGNYLIGGAKIDSVNNYELHEIDLSGNTISNTYIPIYQTIFGDNGMIKPGYFNDYFVKYQNDSMITTSVWMTRFFVERRANNGTLIWRKMEADTSATGSLVIFEILPTPDGGVIYTIEKNYLVPGKVDVIKLDSNGNEMWSADPKAMVNALPAENYNFGPIIFLGTDSTILTSFSIATYTGGQQRSYILRLDCSNGSMSDSVSVYNKIMLCQGTMTSQNKVLVNFIKYNYATSTYTDQGYLTFDDSLNFLGIEYVPVYPPSFGAKLIANNLGGAFLAYEGMVYSYFAENFDSLFVTYPSEISGTIHIDNNTNCIGDGGDVLIGNSLVILTDSSGISTYANAQYGDYSFHVPYGNYTVSHAIQYNKFGECPISGTYNFSITSDTTISNANFYDTLVSGLNDLAVFLAPTCFVPGFNSILHAYYYNAGTVTTTTTLKVVIDDSINFVSSTPAPSSISGDTLFYSIGPVYYDSIGMVDIQLNTPATLLLGTVLTFIASVPSAGDLSPEDNADTLQSIVVGAFDPNDKAVNQPYYIDGTEEMVYKIQFQNTGTLAATNVVVTDTLDSDLNFSTFKLLSTSHPVNINFSIGSKIDFEFMNIQLPDSTSNEAGSHGEIVYSVKMNTGLATGTIIKNKAFIYFDYNAPIITNTTVNKIGVSPVGINESMQTNLDFNLYPNPAKEELLVVSQSKIQTLEILDITGRKILDQTINGLGRIQLTITGIESGIYIVRITTNKGSSSKKLVINR